MIAWHSHGSSFHHCEAGLLHIVVEPNAAELCDCQHSSRGDDQTVGTCVSHAGAGLSSAMLMQESSGFLHKHGNSILSTGYGC
jgi:hypothetical protein